MYAIDSNVSVGNPDAARLLLPRAREAIVSRAPGMHGYWLEPVEGVGTSVIIFETQAEAETAREFPLPPMPGVKTLDVTVREAFAAV
jgi:hypothetical protein